MLNQRGMMMKYVILTMLLYVNSFADLGFNLEPTLAIEGNSRGMGLATASLMLNMHLNDKISTGMAYSKSEEPGFENKYPVHTSNAVSIYGRYDTKKLKYLDFSWQFGLGYINGITRGKFIKKEVSHQDESKSTGEQ